MGKNVNEMKEQNMKTNQSVAIGQEVVREGYEASVVARMVGRSGASTQKGASGIALEIMANDKENLKDILKPGVCTKQTKCPTANQVDAVKTQGGKVIERIQYKDTVSDSGVNKTLQQVKNGKYQQTQLKGTTEAAQKFNDAAEKAGISKRMKDTGISHNTTQRVGDKFLGNPATMTGVKDAVKGSAKSAVALTAGVEVVKSVVNGDSVEECTSHVVSKSAESAVSAAVSTAAAEVTIGAVGVLTAGTAAAVAAPLVAGAVVAVGVGTAVSKVTDGAFDGVGEFAGDCVGAVTDAISDVGNAISNVATNIRYSLPSIFW